MNINWDDVAFDAENTPGAVLAEFAAMAEDIESLVVIVAKKPTVEGQDIRCVTSGQGIACLGLTAYAKDYLTNFVAGREE